MYCRTHELLQEFSRRDTLVSRVLVTDAAREETVLQRVQCVSRCRKQLRLLFLTRDTFAAPLPLDLNFRRDVFRMTHYD